MALFHWPIGGSLFEVGRAFYRFWLEATARGLAGWPAAALADDPATSAAVSERLLVPKDRVLVNAIRLGVAEGETPKRTRLPVWDVII